MTGLNENTIKVKLFRARQKLLKAAQRLMRGSVLESAGK
jgi:RNA polymerase sigma-70 factor (ECF subfamily)